MAQQNNCPPDPLMKAILAQYRREARATIEKERREVASELKVTRAELNRLKRENSKLRAEVRTFANKKDQINLVARKLVMEYDKLQKFKGRSLRTFFTDTRAYDTIQRTATAIRNLQKSV